MIVTSLSSTEFRSTTLTAGPPPAKDTAPATPATDSVTLSDAATAPVESAAIEPMRTEQRLVKALDGDGNSRVSKDEFTNSGLAMVRRARQGRVQETAFIQKQEAKWTRRLERAFARADANHDGSIDSGEMANAMGATGQHPVRTDGRLSRQVSVVEVAIRRYTGR